MKAFSIERLSFEHSRKTIYEKHKYLLPTIEVLNDKIGIMYGYQFRLIWWKWWIKMYLTIIIFW